MKNNKKLITALVTLVLLISGAGAGHTLVTQQAPETPAAVYVQEESTEETAEIAPETVEEEESAAIVQEATEEEESAAITQETVEEEESAAIVQEAAEEEESAAITQETAVTEDSATTAPEEAAEEETAALPEDGHYDDREEVCAYLRAYGVLPENYISKKQARKLGWEGGSLEPYVKDGCIGGDVFGNYEGNLPEEKGRKYYECDIDTMGKNKRGAKRIVYSNDGTIYYTEDHYETFTVLCEDAGIRLGVR